MSSQKDVHHFSSLNESQAPQQMALDFTAYLLHSQEEERKRIANEIHDKLGQNLLALRIDVARLHERTLETHPRINSRAGNLLEHIDLAFQNVKDLINYLRPPVLELGIVPSVEWKVREFERYSGIPCGLLVDGEENEYHPFSHYAVPVVRILHELLNNIARHAKANAADVSLSTSPDGMKLNIVDDGVGILPQDLKKPKTYGVAGVKEYVRLMNGSLNIGRMSESGGTVLTVTIPREN